MAKINVVGWYGRDNIGDESYKLSFPKVFPFDELVFSDKPIPNAEHYILGGGDVVSNEFVNKFKNITNKYIMSATVSVVVPLDEFKSVFVRDVRSIPIAALCGVQSQYVPDFAFALESGNPANGKNIIEQTFKKCGHDKYENVIGVVVNAHLMSEYNGLGRDLINFQNFSYELGKCMDSVNASFVFIPFGRGLPFDDRISNGWASTRCKWWKKNAAIYDKLSVQETMDVISSLDACISTRLHSTIFSCICSTPFIDVTHGHKTLGFLESTGLTKYSIPYTACDAVLMSTKLNNLIGSTESKSDLTKTTIKQRTILNSFTKDFNFP